MNKENHELEKLRMLMIEKLADWRKVADELSTKSILTSEDISNYFSTSDAFMNAKENWENYLKEKYT